MNELANQVAIITGGGHGVGRQIALAYARAGAKIAIAARSAGPMEATCAELEAMGSRAIHIRTDVSAEADCQRMVERTLEAFGRIDILVNNAGIAGPTGKITELAPAAWRETIDINLTGCWLASRAVLPVMERQRSGVILNISSVAGRRGYALRTPYAASKWAMIGLTQTLALEWGRHGIRVNCVCPGPVEGERLVQVITARAQALGTTYEKVHDGILATVAMARAVSEDEVARTALFLASDLSAGMTGQTLNVDAGMQMN